MTDPKFTRRDFATRASQLGAAATGLMLGGRIGLASDDEEFDYIVVGAGAGGGPLAANLARAGHRVLVLEAGDTGAPHDPAYDVPAYHPVATEDPRMSWNFFVKHYAKSPERDPKYVAEKQGILYPRAATVGGCTAHNAMIAVYPYNSDWDGIRDATGDDSWSSSRMRGYFERLERCEHRSEPLLYAERERTRHGFHGWLPTNQASLAILARDLKFAKVVGAAAAEFPLETLRNKLDGLDPNVYQVVREQREGVYNVPMSIAGGRRHGARERLLQTRDAHPDRLVVRTNALATRVLFNEDKHAVGVEYRDGAHLYRADPGVGSSVGTRRTVRARREVILAGGAFNSPQLLQLSGIGPSALLRRHGIDPVVDLPGVGQNLQDHLEIGATYRMTSDFSPLRDCTFDPENDPCLDEYRHTRGGGIYGTNGTLCGVIKRSSDAVTSPDLFIFGVPGSFHGYYPGYSRDLLAQKNLFSWIVLKAFSPNDAGSVEIRSADPRDAPDVNFRYFEEGHDTGGRDLTAMSHGLQFVRKIMRSPLLFGHVAEEVLPGPGAASGEALRKYIGDETWGHHASCTNKMGPRSDPGAVVDSRFRVHGVTGLRVVDASVFPKIPGFFIVAPVYMISEKASDVILADARTSR